MILLKTNFSIKEVLPVDNWVDIGFEIDLCIDKLIYVDKIDFCKEKLIYVYRKIDLCKEKLIYVKKMYYRFSNLLSTNTSFQKSNV